MGWQPLALQQGWGRDWKVAPVVVGNVTDRKTVILGGAQANSAQCAALKTKTFCLAVDKHLTVSKKEL